jgi:hypothetical protein
MSENLPVPPEAPEPEDAEAKGKIEQNVEWQMTPLRALMKTEIFKSIGPTSWYVAIEMRAPELTEQGAVRKTNVCKRYGPLNERFLADAERFFRYWAPKAHVQLDIVKIERRYDTVHDANW